MGKTRRRVTFLVLSLEAIGLVLLMAAAYWAGEVRLHCERFNGVVACTAEEKRCLGLLVVQRQRYEDVRAAGIEPPAMARVDHWLSLDLGSGEGTNGGGEQVRVLPGGEARTRADAERLSQLLAGTEPGPLLLRRSSRLWALAAVFGFGWLLVISLIMREFLGYHTPWWWRWFGRK